MAGKFQWKRFSDCTLDDPFFDSLKSDYPEFPTWFGKKCAQGEQVLVYDDEEGICALIYLKVEEEPIQMVGHELPIERRMKIGTLKLGERVQGQRLGEGALGVALWRWQETGLNQVYVTVFPKHNVLIDLLEKFGFKRIGQNNRGECIYLRSRLEPDFSSPFSAFPFVGPQFDKAGYLPIEAGYHDTLFPYSELSRTAQETEELAAANGMSKVFIAFPYSTMHHKVGEPIVVYRIHNGEGRQYRSAITSFCTVTKITQVKRANRVLISFDEYLALVSNKSVYSAAELADQYQSKRNIVVLEMVYNGYFGKGHNVNFKTLKDKGLFNDYPYNVQLTKEQFEEILRMGGKDVQHIIANQP